MAKWADFAVMRVKYNREHAAIVEVEVRPDTGESLGDIQRVLRQTVVNAILGGQTFVTSYERNSKWEKGAEVRTVLVYGERFLRTDSNAVRSDNLGNLPEYA